jgi:hypothetical protein
MILFYGEAARICYIPRTEGYKMSRQLKSGTVSGAA